MHHYQIGASMHHKKTCSTNVFLFPKAHWFTWVMENRCVHTREEHQCSFTIEEHWSLVRPYWGGALLQMRHYQSGAPMFFRQNLTSAHRSWSTCASSPKRSTSSWCTHSKEEHRFWCANTDEEHWFFWVKITLVHMVHGAPMLLNQWRSINVPLPKEKHRCA